MNKTVKGQSEIIIQPQLLTQVLVGIVLFLAAGHIAVHAGSLLFDIKSTPLVGLFDFFVMDGEGNLPAYVSALFLLLSGTLCAFIAYTQEDHKKGQTWYWWGLAIGFLIMSFDEAAQIHEGIVGEFILATSGSGEGVFYYTWFKAYIPIVLALSCLYIPFLRRLSFRYTWRLILAGFTYLSGSIGFEIFESYLAYHERSIGLSVLLEETFEMLGIVILIYTLLLYIAESRYSLLVQFKAKDNQSKQSKFSPSIQRNLRNR